VLLLLLPVLLLFLGAEEIVAAARSRLSLSCLL
jgi:hypothetical protein